MTTAPLRQRRQIEPIEPCALHADRARVDEQPRARHSRADLRKRPRRDRRAEFVCQRLGPAQCAVDELYTRHAAVDQGGQDGPRCAAGPDHHRRSKRLVPARCLGIEIGEKPYIIGVRSPDLAVVGHQGIDRTDPSGQRIDLIDQPHHRFLVGDRDIAAHEFTRAQPGYQAGKIGRRNFDRFIAGLEPMLGNPALMDQG